MKIHTSHRNSGSIIIWLSYSTLWSEAVLGLMQSPRSRSTRFAPPSSSSSSSFGGTTRLHATSLSAATGVQKRDSLRVPDSSIVLEPVLGINQEFWAPSDATLPSPSCFDSVVLAASRNNKDRENERIPFRSDASVHILRKLSETTTTIPNNNNNTNVWKEFLPDAAVEAAESTGVWSTGRHHLYPTTDQIAADLPLGVGGACLELATRVILPAIAVAFATPLNGLYFKDMFLAKYEPTGQAGLGKHTDGSAYSFNMLLSTPNRDFEGGGTWIEPVGLVSPSKGEVLLHRGSILHEGCPVTKGTRYVLVGFVQERSDTSINAIAINNGSGSRSSEVFVKTVMRFPLGMVLEVDEGDKQKCTMVVDLVAGGAAELAGICQQDCLRGILLPDDKLLVFDGMTFDDVMDILVGRKDLGPVQFVVERWSSSDGLY